MACILLIDNGSKRTGATLQLRRLATGLSDRTGQPVYPVSLQHADAIDVAEMGGEPALMFTEFIGRKLQKGEREFVVLPLFFGNSRALTSYIPQQVALLEEQYGEFELRLAQTLYPLPEGDPRLAEILYDHTMQTIRVLDHDIRHAVLVEHGSPLPEVNKVRRDVAVLLEQLLQSQGHYELGQAVMERRKGDQFDFNGDLLEDWLVTRALDGIRHIVVVMLFILPGRHAGEDGDIEIICQNVMERYPGLEVHITPLVSEHPRILDMLESRLAAVQRT
jgi:sirohydrochlorin ferrochelatase